MYGRAEGLNLDLNLIVALDALLEEKNVTRAARKLHLSQPTLSTALSKLRRHFDDPLLVRSGSGYELSPLAERLAVQVTETVQSARRLLDRNIGWSPSESTREFTVLGADYGFAIIGATVLELAKEAAPGVRVRFLARGNMDADDPAGSLRTADVLLRPHGSILELPFDNVWRDRWVALASSENHEVGDALAGDEVERHPWVLSHHSRSAFTSADLKLRERGLPLTVDAVVDSFFAMPSFVIGTDRLAIVPERLLAAIPMGGLKAMELPFGGEPIEFAVWWHPSRDVDPEHAWFRSLFRLAGRIVTARSR